MRLPSTGEKNSPKQGSPFPVSSPSLEPQGSVSSPIHQSSHHYNKHSPSFMMDTDLDLLFNPGNIINCTTCFDQKLEGEVVAFDYLQRIIVLKTQSSVQPNHHDVILLNLKAVGDVKVISEAKKEDISSKPINIPKLDERVREAVAEREALERAFKSGVTEDGLKLFLNLSKTIGRDVTWNGPDIIVNTTVLIKPPYRSENCCLSSESTRNDKTLAYVQQLVSRFWTDSGKSSNRPSPEKETASASTTQQSSPSPSSAAPTAASIVAGTANKQHQASKQQQQNQPQSNGSGDSSLPVNKGSKTSVGQGSGHQQQMPPGKKGSRNGS